MGNKDDGVIKEGLPDISPYPYQPLKITEEDFGIISGKPDTKTMKYKLIFCR